MSKDILKHMPLEEKIVLICRIMDTIKAPAIFTCKINDEDVTCHGTQYIESRDYCELMAGHMIATAKLSGTTPIKILSAVGDMMSELMNREERSRAKKTDKKKFKATKPTDSK